MTAWEWFIHHKYILHINGHDCVGLWSKLTDLAKPKQAIVIHLSLTGSARLASSELTKEQLKEENDV